MTGQQTGQNSMGHEVLEARIRFLESENAWLRTLLQASLQGRIASTLLRFERSGLVRLTQERLAELIGGSRESVTKILGEWRRAGLVETGYRYLRILDRAALTQLAGEPEPGAGSEGNEWAA